MMNFVTELPKPLPNFSVSQIGNLYLVLDGSQIEELDKKLLSQGFSIQLVCPIPLLPLRPVSPFIVEMSPEVLDWFLQLNTANQGYVIHSPLSESQLAELLIPYYQVLTPYGSEVFFKIGQPEMAFILLNDKALSVWQGVNQAWFPTRLGWETLVKDPNVELAKPNEEYRLTDHQWKAIDNSNTLNLMEDIHQYLSQFFPNYLNAQSQPYVWIRDKITEANQLGFELESDIKSYLSVLALLGESVLTTEQYPEIRQLIQQPSIKTASQRIEEAHYLACKTVMNSTS